MVYDDDASENEEKNISFFLVGDTDVYKALVNIWVIYVLNKLLITSKY